MTDNMMNLCALVEKTPDAELLREMIGSAAMHAGSSSRRRDEPCGARSFTPT